MIQTASTGSDSEMLRVAIIGDGTSQKFVDRLTESASVSNEAGASRARYVDIAGRPVALFELSIGVSDTARFARTLQESHAAVIVIHANVDLTAARRAYYLSHLLGVPHVISLVARQPADDDGQLQSLYESCLSGTDVNVAETIGLADSETEPADLLRRALQSAEIAKTDAMRAVMVNRDADEKSRIRLLFGELSVGDTVYISSSEQTAKVSSLRDDRGDCERVRRAQEATVEFQPPITPSHTDLIADGEHRCSQTDQFAAHVIWFGDEALLPERQYLLHTASGPVIGQVTDLRYSINTDSMEHLAAKKLDRDEIGHANFAMETAVAFDPYEQHRETGFLTLSDLDTGEWVGYAIINFGLRRATNLTWHESGINKVSRAQQKGQKPCVLWFTGLSGSGKSTVANALEIRLRKLGRHSYLLDGDNVRHGLNKDLGFTDQDRVENIRRVAEVSKLMVDAGLIVVVSFISPFRSERRMARELVEHDEFIEVYMDTPLAVCEQRDPKGLYKKARAGEIKNFTGIDSDYEAPESAEIALHCDKDPETLADQLVEYLERHAYL